MNDYIYLDQVKLQNHPINRVSVQMKEYLVDQVLQLRHKTCDKQQKEFLVQWKGYALNECTWEPIKHFNNGYEVLNEYMRWKNDIKLRLSRQQYKWTKGPFTYYVRKNTTFSQNLYDKKQTFVVASDSEQDLNQKTNKLARKNQKNMNKNHETLDMLQSGKDYELIVKLCQEHQIILKQLNSQYKMLSKQIKIQIETQASINQTQVKQQEVLETIRQNLKIIDQQEFKKDKSIIYNDNIIKKSKIYENDSVQEIPEDEESIIQSSSEDCMKNQQGLAQIQNDESSTFGSFEYGDIINFIQQCGRKDGELVYDVEWKPRQTGFRPKQSQVTNSQIKVYQPEILFNYYESKLTFKGENG